MQDPRAPERRRSAGRAASSSGLPSSASTTRPLSLSSILPLTSTGPRCLSATPQARYGSGKTVSGTDPSTSSRVAKAMRLPLFVEFSVMAPTRPRSSTREAAGRVASSEAETVLRRAAISRYSSSGWPER